MLRSLLDVVRRHIILFGTAKFTAGLVIGFALGVYFLPILTEEKMLDSAALAQLDASAERSGTFTRDLPGSDTFHWGEGTVRASASRICLDGRVSPGPDYRPYLTPSLATDEDSFLRIRAQSVQIGEIKAFSNFSLEVPPGIDAGGYGAVLVWCDAFGEFITAAELR